VGRLFGTDGIRGVANDDLTPELALSVGAAAAEVLGASARGERPVAVVGRDPRASGELLEAAIVAGLASAGADVVRLGVLPTPAVAFLTTQLGADLGVMLTASHNPMPDNGIKLFDRTGHKLPDDVEDTVAAALGARVARPTGRGVGRVRDDHRAVETYVEHLLGSVDVPLHGLRVVVDCAHGAASHVAPHALQRAGVRVSAVGAEPDGWNINDGVGSTHLENLQAAVLREQADLGLAHDGDADRCLAVDADGEPVDGDAILAVLALDAKSRGQLPADAVATTVMTNLGFHRLMADAGIEVVQTAVGDRYVLEAMRERDLALGGEQSGHVIFRDRSTTGDGVLTALRLLACLARSGRSLAELAGVLQRLPQVLLNVRVDDREVAGSAAVLTAVAEAERELAGRGRVLLRPSGTEPVVRVMVEAEDPDQAQRTAESLAEVVRGAPA
jgi:phosphoglucosamine mutase